MCFGDCHWWGVSEDKIGTRMTLPFEAMAAETSACPTRSSGAKMAPRVEEVSGSGLGALAVTSHRI